MKNIIQTINNNGILSSLFASVIFAGIVFFVTKAERKLVSKITFHDEVLNRQENPDFLLYYKDTLPIKNNLYLTHIEFWNEGTTPIRSEDLLEEIQIKLSDGKIIGNVEIEETHPKVIKAAVNYLDSGNALALRFNFLENTNGIKLRFYYVGEQKSNIKMDAYITGGNGVSNSSNPLELLLLLAILISGMIGVFALFKVWKKMPQCLTM